MRYLTVVVMLCATTLGSITAPAAALQADAGKQQAALVAEQVWLAQVDAGKYQDAWDQAAPTMQAATQEGDFAKSIHAARDPLGPLKSRVLEQEKLTTQLPGAPDGEYCVTQFKTQFANKAAGVETVIASRQTDGSWRVTGYFIR